MAGIVLDNAPTVGPGPWKPSVVVASSSTVMANGKKIVLDGDPVITHIKPGKSPSPISGKVIASSGKVFVEGKAIAQIGDVCSKGEVLVESSTSVFAS